LTYIAEHAAGIRSILARWRGKRVLILGDMILDEFIFGRTDRVSREAPVVVVRYDRSSCGLGGAANAAQNVASLGGAAVPIGIVGRDEAGSKLRALLAGKGIPVRCLISSGERCTTSKIRVMAGDYHAQQQQIVRIDKEQNGVIAPETEQRLLTLFRKELRKADAVIVSDYHQGLFTDRMIRESIGLCRESGKPVVADSRFRLGRFTGVTSATPNEVEAASAAGVEIAGDVSIEKIGRRLLRRLASGSILVTRGKLGMALFEPRRRIKSVEVVGSPEATDVTGAGDTVVSAVALTLSAGSDMTAAMHIANMAASIVVMKRGTAVATQSELLSLISGAQARERGESL
jgi:rfaE bifunctional protein kinase chain/domain